MSDTLQKIGKSKQAMRRELASRPIADKLRMLDAMRERDAAIRQSSPPRDVTSPLKPNP